MRLQNTEPNNITDGKQISDRRNEETPIKFEGFGNLYKHTHTHTHSQRQSPLLAINRDFFGWGTSGYNHGANCYQPWSTSIEDSDYYAYGNATYHLTDQTRQADWGYNAIRNGGNQENIGWYTLTQSEWTHVINGRYTESGYRYAKATVNDVLGIILLPDNWKAETFALNNSNTQNAGYSSNPINADDWTNILEANGAVFLPCAGFRDNFFGSIKEVNQNGYYWADECAGDEAGYAYFSTSFVSPTGSNYRDEGHSVRLVIPAE